jgi:hypothetical protein
MAELGVEIYSPGMADLEGTPSDELSDVLATGTSDASFAFISMSAREPGGRDAEYIEWHTLDHRPEQHRLAGLRTSLRLVSTPECRAARAASIERFDGADHVMTYVFAGPESIPGFNALGGALHKAGRMPLRLPTVEFMTADLAGKVANPLAVAGADVLPHRPALGVYLLIEDGHESPESLIDVAGVAGAWWYHGNLAPSPYGTDARGLQVTYLYLDEDPLIVAERLGGLVQKRWVAGDVDGLLAAPYYTIVPFDWARHVPTGSTS